MTHADALAKLKHIADLQASGHTDYESHHDLADEILLQVIDDPAITTAFERIEKWYA